MTNLIIIYDNEDGSVLLSDNNGNNSISLPISDFIDVTKMFFDKQGYDVTKREPELKSCPVCGREAVYQEMSVLCLEGLTRGYIYCPNCGIEQDTVSPKSKALDKWNALPRNVNND